MLSLCNLKPQVCLFIFILCVFNDILHLSVSLQRFDFSCFVCFSGSLFVFVGFCIVLHLFREILSFCGNLAFLCGGFTSPWALFSLFHIPLKTFFVSLWMLIIVFTHIVCHIRTLSILQIFCVPLWLFCGVLSPVWPLGLCPEGPFSNLSTTLGFFGWCCNLRWGVMCWEARWSAQGRGRVNRWGAGGQQLSNSALLPTCSSSAPPPSPPLLL